jgi:hypothetical protein
VTAEPRSRRVDRLSLVVGVLFVAAGVVFLLDALDVGGCGSTTWCRSA